MSVKAKFAISTLSIFLTVCLAIIFWYVYVMLFLPVKISSSTIYVDDQTIHTESAENSDVEISKKLVEINIYDNMFEVVLNFLADENANAFYSYCLQFVSDTPELDFSASYNGEAYNKQYSSDSRNYFLWKKEINNYHNFVYANTIYKNLKVYGYSNFNDGANDLWHNDDLKSIERDNLFKLQLTNSDETNKIIGMSLRYTDIDFSTNSDLYVSYSNNVSNNGFGSITWNHYNNYRPCDIYYFCEYLYNQYKGLNTGSYPNTIVKFNDIFNYYDCDENYNYTKMITESDRLAKVKADIQSYFAIKVTVNDGVADNANQSLVGFMYGVQNYGVNAENTYDYSIGRTIYNLTEDDFTLSFDENLKCYKLIISNNFVEKMSKYVNDIRLNITIDLFRFSKYKIENIKVFTENFFVYKINGVEVNQKLNGYLLGGGT